MIISTLFEWNEIREWETVPAQISKPVKQSLSDDPKGLETQVCSSGRVDLYLRFFIALFLRRSNRDSS